MMVHSPPLELVRELGQLQAQLQHLPTVESDDYQRHLAYTRHFASKVLVDLEHFVEDTTSRVSTHPIELDQVQKEERRYEVSRSRTSS
jgi:hypothetical protein